MSLTKLSLAGNNKIIPSQESLDSDIPAGDKKMANLFYSLCVSLVMANEGEEAFF
jgi:hypothetical protein